MAQKKSNGGKVRQKKTCFLDILNIEPITKDIPISQQIQKLKWEFQTRNATIIRKRLLINAMNKGLQNQIKKQENPIKSMEIKTTTRTKLDEKYD